MKHILILGGSGFIGRNLVEYLSEKNDIYKVMAPTHKELDLLDSDAVDSFFGKNTFDVVVFAVSSGDYRIEDHSDELLNKNLKMFFNVVNNRDRFDRMIFLGSGAEYDRFRDVKDVKESDFGKDIPTDEYGLYKYKCSEYIAKSDNIVNLRLFGVFGKYEDYSKRFISDMIHRKISGTPLVINRNRMMSYIYIDDLVKIIEYFILNKPKHKFYNVSNGEVLELFQIAEMIRDISYGGSASQKIEIITPGHNPEYTCDASLLKRELNFEFTPIHKSITDFFGWFVINRDIIDDIRN